MHRPRRPHAGIQLDLPKSALVSRHVLLQQSQQRLGLLRAQIDPLEIPNIHLRLGLLLQSAKHQEKIPDIHPHLHAVSVILAIIRIIAQLHIRLGRIIHGEKCNPFRDVHAGGNQISTIRDLPPDKNCYLQSRNFRRRGYQRTLLAVLRQRVLLILNDLHLPSALLSEVLSGLRNAIKWEFLLET